MRMMMPGLRDRRTVDELLTLFFRQYDLGAFRRAVGAMTRFYCLRVPPIRWFEYLDWGKGAGRTFEDGTIHLVHPENWKRGRKYNTMKQWIHTVHHEIGHYVLWTDAERKADVFASGMMHGLEHEAAARALAPRPAMRTRLIGTRRSVGRRRSSCV